jgi:hypothetical protein
MAAQAATEKVRALAKKEGEAEVEGSPTHGLETRC